MRPPAVCSRVRSTPCCSASRRANGDAFTGEAPVDGEATGAALGGGAVASLAATMTAIVLPTGTTDRKSTRLNSSHLVISYAVFCLKKKKKTEDTAAILH